jgi:FkbM family methyltransferase
MTSFLHCSFRYVISRTWYLLNPRAIMWRHIKKRHPSKTIIAKLGKDLKVRIYTHDVIGRDIYVQGMFEKAECKFVTNFLKQGMIFFDIGANLGQYTLFGAKRVGNNGRVHSFEPSSRMFSELKFNVELNNLSNICILNNVAVSEKEGTAKLSKYEPGGEVFGSLGNQNWAESSKSIIGHEEVRTIILDKYIKEHNINHIDLIKMDIEGAELLALRGAYQLLHQAKAPTIILEIADVNTDGFGYKAMNIWDYLESLGYRMHCLDKHGSISGWAERPPDFVKAQNLVAIKPH